jgi:uncharacterized protein YwgA
MVLNPEVLAGLYKRLYQKLDMSDFDDRFRMQKFVYIAQSQGINLGFFFNFYLFGPYSTDLARTAFQITNFEKAKTLKFKDEVHEQKFSEIISVLSKFKDDNKWLECASSILFLKSLGYSRRHILNRIGNKVTRFENEYIVKVWTELINLGWLND